VARAHLRVGRPDKEIVDLAEEIDAGLVVVGSRGLGGVRRALVGSVSDSVVRHAPCPVLVVRQARNGHPRGRTRREGAWESECVPNEDPLGADGSTDSSLTVRVAAHVSKGIGSELHVVHVLPQFSQHVYPRITPELYSYVLD